MIVNGKIFMDTDEQDEVSQSVTGIKMIEDQVLTINDETPAEQIAIVRAKVKHLGAEARRVSSLLNQVLLERIQATGRDIELPGVRLYAGVPPKYREKDRVELLSELLAVCDGDLHAMGECLASNWFLVSAVRSRMEQAGHKDAFDRLIETTREAEIKEGKPAKKLLESNDFMESRRAHRDDSAK